MIKLNKYHEKFENEYYDAVNKSLKDKFNKIEFINSCKKYLPDDFFDKHKTNSDGEKDDFKTLILAPFSQLKKAYTHILEDDQKMQKECFTTEPNTKNGKEEKTRTALYDTLYNLYDSVSKSELKKMKMNVRIVKNLNVTVCPYCNRDYINCRGDKISGAQLDHFYPRSEFPVFSVCLYNLIPVCGNCNRIKSSKNNSIISPFDEVDFDNSLKISYIPVDNCKVKLTIQGENGLQNNISEMHIDTAYEINHIDIEELIYKAKVYNKTRMNELITQFEKLNLSENEMNSMVFGEKIESKDYLRKPLSKLKSDILKELKIWKE